MNNNLPGRAQCRASIRTLGGATAALHARRDRGRRSILGVRRASVKPESDSPGHVELVGHAAQHGVHVVHGAHEVVGRPDGFRVRQARGALPQEAEGRHLATHEPVLVVLVAEAVAHPCAVPEDGGGGRRVLGGRRSKKSFRNGPQRKLFTKVL